MWMVNLQTKWGIHNRVFVIPIRGKAVGTAVPLIRNQRVLSRGYEAGRHIKRRNRDGDETGTGFVGG